MAKNDTSACVVVLDAGPLIHLDELAVLSLLEDFAELLVPDEVWNEVEIGFIGVNCMNKQWLIVVRPRSPLSGAWSSFLPLWECRHLVGDGPQGRPSFPRSPWECSPRRSSGESQSFSAALGRQGS
jgi:hypothetical protein